MKYKWNEIMKSFLSFFSRLMDKIIIKVMGYEKFTIWLITRCFFSSKLF